MMGDLASEVVRHIVDYLRKRDAERTGWDDGGAFGVAADEIEGLGSLWSDLAASRTQNLTDTPAAVSVGMPCLLRTLLGMESAPQDSRIAELEEKVAHRDAHLNAIRARLRIECDELGDNSWPNDLHLADVIDRYLCRPVRDQVQALENEVGVLRDRERDAGQQLLVESDRMAKLNGDLCAEVNALREEVRRLTDRERDIERGVVAEIVGWLRHTHLTYIYATVASRIERGDWRAKPHTQSQPEPAPVGYIAYTPTANLYGEGEVTPVEACPHGVPYRWPYDECDAEVSTPICPHGAPIGYGPGCAQCDADEVPCD